MTTDSPNPFESPQQAAVAEDQQRPTAHARINTGRVIAMVVGLVLIAFAPFEWIKAVSTSALFIATGMLSLFTAPMAWIKANVLRFMSMLLVIGGFCSLFGFAIWFFGLLFSIAFRYMIAEILEFDPETMTFYMAAELFRLFVSICGGLIVVRNTGLAQHDHRQR